MPDQSITKLFYRLWIHLSKVRRFQFGFLLLIMIAVSFAEFISIGAILPFLAVLTDPNKVFDHPRTQQFIQALEISSSEELLLPVTIIFGCAAISAGALRLSLNWASMRLSFAAGCDISSAIYLRTLYQPFSVHAARNSSEVINGIVNKSSGVIYGVLSPALSIISCGLMLIAILAILLSVDTYITVAAFTGFSLIYGIIIWLTRSQKIRNSQVIAKESTQVFKSLQEGLGGIRDIIIDNSQIAYCQIYRNADRPWRLAEGSNQFLAQAPRYGVETIGIVVIALLAYVFVNQSNSNNMVMPVIGLLALGAQRMLPVMQLLYVSLSSIQGAQASLKDVLNLLDQPMPNWHTQLQAKPLDFSKGISLKGVSFRYSPQTQWVIKNLNLEIAKGERVGFIGKTGAGKSTLLDIIMGLLEPTEGFLSVDGMAITTSNCRAWQLHISHVPQVIYLADSTIEENIAFGEAKNTIDPQRIIEAAQQAQIADVIETWPKQYKTSVGERGVRLSGGQRQRIGIARALYKKADVIIFDEATSSLDNDTENAVMDAIDALGGEITVLIIAHRLTTLKKCTKIVEVSDGGILRTGSYQEIINQLI